MSKTKIKKSSLRLTFPRIPPYNKVEDYFVSKIQCSNVQLPGFEWDKPRTDPELQLTSAIRSYERTLQALDTKREYYKKQRVNLDNQWKELEELEDTFKDNFVKLDNFIRSNEDKRSRAVERTKEDKKAIIERIKQIEKITEDTGVIEEIMKEFCMQINAHSIYEKYLNSVITEAPEFKNPEVLIDRYESLVKTKNSLGQRQSETLSLLEQAKNKMGKMIEENAFRTLGMTTTLASLQARYQIAFTRAMHWERIVWGIKSYALQRYKEITEVKQSCRNIYTLMSRRKKEMIKIDDDDFEKQLLYIKRTLQQLAVVTAGAARMNKKAISSVKVEASQMS